VASCISGELCQYRNVVVVNCYVASSDVASSVVASCVAANCVVASCYVANCMGIKSPKSIFVIYLHSEKF
jgi:hypothetical protein